MAFPHKMLRGILNRTIADMTLSESPGIWPQYSQACRRDVDALLKRGGSLSAYRANPKFGPGPAEGSWAFKLEREIERKFKVRHAVVCNSGTAALHMALDSLHLNAGDEVITSPYTFSATVSAILMARGTPVFADVDPYTFCITPITVSAVRSALTKAVVPVHLFGRVQHHYYGLHVVHDACQAVGAYAPYSNQSTSCAAFSFNGTKNLPCGEGGALVTNSADSASHARLLMNHAENFGIQRVGYNYRMNEVTACIAWHGLKDLEKRNAWRSELVKIALPETWMEGHAYYVAPFKVPAGTRPKFIQECANRGLEVTGGYITPILSKYPAFKQYARGPLPNATELSEQTLCLISTLRWPATKAYARWVRGVLQAARCASGLRGWMFK